MPKKKTSLKKSLDRLESIIEEISEPNIEIEDAMKLYEEGIKLSSYCNELLNNIEQKILILKQSKENTFELTDFKIEN